MSSLATNLELNFVYIAALSQGYADELKEQGMVQRNLRGEDITKVRRQQFEVSHTMNTSRSLLHQRKQSASLSPLVNRGVFRSSPRLLCSEDVCTSTSCRAYSVVLFCPQFKIFLPCDCRFPCRTELP